MCSSLVRHASSTFYVIWCRKQRRQHARRWRRKASTGHHLTARTKRFGNICAAQNGVFLFCLFTCYSAKSGDLFRASTADISGIVGGAAASWKLPQTVNLTWRGKGTPRETPPHRGRKVWTAQPPRRKINPFC